MFLGGFCSGSVVSRPGLSWPEGVRVLELRKGL